MCGSRRLGLRDLQGFQHRMLKSANADRRQRYRQRRTLAQVRGVRISRRNINENPLTKSHTPEIGTVGTQCFAGTGACLGVSNEGTRHFAANGALKVFDVSHVLDDAKLAWMLNVRPATRTIQTNFSRLCFLIPPNGL
jgi:hypothetical protein